MKKHTTEQIIRKLREGEVMAAQGKGIAEVCQALEISSQTYDRWKKRYGQLDRDDVRRLRELEEQNRRLKKLVAEQALDIQILNEVNKGKW